MFWYVLFGILLTDGGFTWHYHEGPLCWKQIFAHFIWLNSCCWEREYCYMERKKKTFATKMYSIAEISCICCFIILWVSVAVANVVKHVCKWSSAKGTVWYLMWVLIIVKKHFLVQFSHLIKKSWKKTVPEANSLTGTLPFILLILIRKV